MRGPGLPDQASARTAAQRETLLYFVMLRQIEADSPALREAFARLAQAASEALGWDPSTIVLDWLEGELRTLRTASQPHSPTGAVLMGAAVALAKALKQ